MFAKLLGGLIVALALTATSVSGGPAFAARSAGEGGVGHRVDKPRPCCRPGQECCKGNWQPCCRR